MSLDISLTNAAGGEVVSLNWLRNPYGLERWAADTYRLATGQDEPARDLWHVINYWNYDQSAQVDRQRFKRVVDEYWRVIEPLEEGYFFFNIAEYIHFVEPHLALLPRDFCIASVPSLGTKIAGSRYVFHWTKLAIPIEHFQARVFNLGRASLAQYQAWFADLVRFAELLQDPANTFYCSN